MDGILPIAHLASPPPRPPLAVLVALLRCWRARIGERRALAAMDERLLRDIGVNRLDAARQCVKLFSPSICRAGSEAETAACRMRKRRVGDARSALAGGSGRAQ